MRVVRYAKLDSDFFCVIFWFVWFKGGVWGGRRGEDLVVGNCLVLSVC